MVSMRGDAILSALVRRGPSTPEQLFRMVKVKSLDVVKKRLKLLASEGIVVEFERVVLPGQRVVKYRATGMAIEHVGDRIIAMQFRRLEHYWPDPHV